MLVKLDEIIVQREGATHRTEERRNDGLSIDKDAIFKLWGFTLEMATKQITAILFLFSKDLQEFNNRISGCRFIYEKCYIIFVDTSQRKLETSCLFCYLASTKLFLFKIILVWAQFQSKQFKWVPNLILYTYMFRIFTY